MSENSGEDTQFVEDEEQQRKAISFEEEDYEELNREFEVTSNEAVLETPADQVPLEQGENPDFAKP
jgi:hypothetical protein